MTRLELYVCGSAPSSVAAREHAERLRIACVGAGSEVAVFDLNRSPLAAQEARVLVVPTLIARSELGERRCFGDFSDLDATCTALGLVRNAP